MAIKIIRTSNGELIIGDFIDSVPGILSVKEPYILLESMSGPEYNLTPFPLLPIDDNEIVSINPDCVLVKPCNPKKQLLDGYMQLTSKLIIPKPDLKLV